VQSKFDHQRCQKLGKCQFKMNQFSGNKCLIWNRFVNVAYSSKLHTVEEILDQLQWNKD